MSERNKETRMNKNLCVCCGKWWCECCDEDTTPTEVKAVDDNGLDMFRCFIRTNHLTKKWDDFIENYQNSTPEAQPFKAVDQNVPINEKLGDIKAVDEGESAEQTVAQAVCRKAVEMLVYLFEKEAREDLSDDELVAKWPVEYNALMEIAQFTANACYHKTEKEIAAAIQTPIPISKVVGEIEKLKELRKIPNNVTALGEYDFCIERLESFLNTFKTNNSK